MDVRATVERLAEMGVRVHCLALGGMDLTSAAGKMTMGVLTAVVEFERDLFRAHALRARARTRRGKEDGTTEGHRRWEAQRRPRPTGSLRQRGQHRTRPRRVETNDLAYP